MALPGQTYAGVGRMRFSKLLYFMKFDHGWDEPRNKISPLQNTDLCIQSSWKYHFTFFYGEIINKLRVRTWQVIKLQDGCVWV